MNRFGLDYKSIASNYAKLRVVTGYFIIMIKKFRFILHCFLLRKYSNELHIQGRGLCATIAKLLGKSTANICLNR